MKYTLLLLAVGIMLLVIPANISQPSFNGTNPGCDGSGCHTLQDGLVSATVTDLQIAITVGGTTSSVAGELVDANGTVVAFNNSTGNNPFTLTAPGPGTYTVNAGFKNPSPRRWDSTVVVIGSPPTTFQLTVSIANNWNMVTIPGLHPVNQNVNTWWQFRDPGANVFKYSGGYQSVTDATPGTGYWMKHSGARVYNTGDEWPAGGIQIVPHNSITAAAGWNLFGGYENIVQTANLTTTPPNQISGPVYKYSGGYQVATTLDPGYGYWIKLLSACQINIPNALPKGSSGIVEYFKEDWGKITITDAAGISYTLYAVKGEVDLNQYELPPAAPSGMFDIRFSSGRIAEDLNNAIKTIEMNGIEYPLTVRVEGMEIRLQDETGKNVNINLKSGEETVISNTTINKLMVSEELLLNNYGLEQNYPNPFNPSTKIKYTIPSVITNKTKQSQLVSLKVYDVLGNEVATLVNEEKSAGNYEVNFSAKGGSASGGNAYSLSSGIYFYKLQAGNFTETKKMLLMK